MLSKYIKYNFGGYRCGTSTIVNNRRLKVKIYRTIVVSVVLYGCETWSLTLREELRLRVFENRVLRRIFVSKRDEVTGVVEKTT